MELTEKIIKILKTREAYAMIKDPIEIEHGTFKKNDKDDYFDTLLNDATILSMEAET